MTGAVAPFTVAARAAFYGVAAVVLAGGWIAVSARNLFRAALGLAACLFGVAVLYLFLEAEFLAVSQLLIYVGAILTLILFGVMLTARIADPAQPRWNAQAGWAAVLAVAVGIGLARAFLTTSWKIQPAPPVTLEALGRSLITVYLLPFELLSVLLVGALVGAIWIARKES